MGWECEGNVMGGKQARGFMVEIQEETKREKKDSCVNQNSAGVF